MSRVSRQKNALYGLLAGFLLASAAVAQDVQPGSDLFHTDPATTFQNFSGSPIPADFFGPGSDPFDGIINFGGQPLGPSSQCPNDDLGLLGVDTIVERPAPAQLPGTPSSDTIPIEIVELSLVSIQPIVVTFNGGQNPELWDVRLGLSQMPQAPGQMNVTKLNSLGGTFDSVLPVLPKFVFEPVGGGTTRELDFGLLGMQPVQFQAQDVPWVYGNPPATSCTSNFCVNPNNLTVEQSLDAQHGVISICLEAGQQVPTVSTWLLVGLAALLSVAAAYKLRRRRGIA